jgi:two-component system chemotaxis response regulator CheY
MVKVLIVDDAAFMRMSLKNILMRNGYEVIGEAGNGAVGVAQYKALQPDLVTMDVTMPEMSGIEALKEIKAINPKANVIMISAMGQESMVLEAITNGAKTFIVKPFKEEYVVDTIKKVVSL